MPTDTQKWPDDYETGFEHALAIAKMHSSLPAALDAMERELATDGVTPSVSECPYCADEIINGLRPSGKWPQRFDLAQWKKYDALRAQVIAQRNEIERAKRAVHAAHDAYDVEAKAREAAEAELAEFRALSRDILIDPPYDAEWLAIRVREFRDVFDADDEEHMTDEERNTVLEEAAAICLQEWHDASNERPEYRQNKISHGCIACAAAIRLHSRALKSFAAEPKAAGQVSSVSSPEVADHDSEISEPVPAAPQSSGWAMKPREPTTAMLAAANREWDGRMWARSAGVWRAMFDAAPERDG